MENLALRCSITQAKIMGTIVSISGALVVVFYKGPTIISSSQSTSLSLRSPQGTSETQWVIGGLLLAASNLLFSGWYIVQVFYVIGDSSNCGLDCSSVYCAGMC